MTNTVAFSLVTLIGLSIAADLMLNDGAAFVFMSKKLLDAIDWVAFWR